MTIDELIERLQWHREGRLQYRKGMACDGPEWFDWPANSHSMLVLGDRADFYRRRPDPPPMPDEVWLPEYGCLREKGIYWTGATCYLNRDACAESNESATPVRYVRAGAVIPASQIEVRQSNGAWVEPHHTNEYRIKP